MNKLLKTFILGLVIILQSCITKTMNEQQYYTTHDFTKIAKIDAHVHINTSNTAFAKQALKDNFILLSINTEVPDYTSINKQQEYTLGQISKTPGRVYFLSTFETDTRDNPEWHKNVIDDLKTSFSHGAVGIKVWKNIGMVIMDNDGSFIKIDDPLFDPVFNFLVENNITVCGHIGEPKNCWLPLEEMTVNNDKAYYSNHPEYHMFLHTEDPSYEELIESRDRLLDKHPKLKFVGAHLGSMEWSVDEIAKRLDKYPNMAVDLTSRICHLQHQSILDWQRVYDFFVKYQDRVLYGTDLEIGDSGNQEEFAKTAHDLWADDWKYFVTDDILEVSTVNGQFKGLKLSRDIVDKIYYKNAMNWYPKILPLSDSLN